MADKKNQFVCAFCGRNSRQSKELFIPSMYEGLAICSECSRKVSEVMREAETARAMAEGVRQRCGADLAVSVTGCAGPDPDERGTPVGTGFVGFAAEGLTLVKPIQMGHDREWGRIYAASTAFDLIRRYLTGLLQPEN